MKEFLQVTLMMAQVMSMLMIVFGIPLLVFLYCLSLVI